MTDSLEPDTDQPNAESANAAADPATFLTSLKKRRRTLAQRLVLSMNIFVIFACFGTAVGVYYSNEKANDRKVVDIFGSEGIPTLTLPTVGEPLDPTTGLPVIDDSLMPVDLTAKNILITGSDNGACIDPNSPYADAFGDRSGIGERSDTIMILRLDPTTNAAAILSFPRDLWVRIGGRTTKSRINSAFNRDDPNELILTIFDNFGLIVDHYINVDFCAFKEIVDAIGGVRVPFATPVRDKRSKLLIETAGCHTFGGEEGLAYVRSRHFYYYKASTKTWSEDPAADRGRISRQQDFLRRAIQKALDKSVGNPRIAKDLVDAGLQYVITDSGLNVGKILDIATGMKNLDPSTMQTYQIEGKGTKIAGQSVIEPALNGENMKAVLAVFQGRARLVDAPDQIFAPTTTKPPATTAPSNTQTTVKPAVTTTLPPVYVESNSVGVLPPDDPSCR
ncbi:MAG: hypothetical protein RL688_666 [Actinomycetota bacterium]